MALETGTRIGIYEVTGKLGEGGMGEVYRAHDTTLDRDVALKVLSEAFTADPDRLARFQREAKVLASLNHPNIGGIYGLESAGETQALVLELIEGPTLADRIAEGPIPVEEALAIATQMADALEAAHEEGIVHRDLKPANVKVRPDGTVKVLDFGLAKAVNPEVGDGSGADNPTISLTGATQMGMVVGTAAYMAPEQAKGKPVDKRADIWAFGVVLLEMLGGKRVFEGETASETLAAVMMKDPSWEGLPTDLPATLDNVLHRCLEKDPRKRVRDIGDVRLAMEGAFETTVEAPIEQAPAPTLKLWQQPIPLAVVAAALLVVGGLVTWTAIRPELPPPPDLIRFGILPTDFGTTGSGARDLAISSDGTQIAYAGQGEGNPQIHLRSVNQFVGAPLRGGSGAVAPFFSPDGQWVGFQNSFTNLLKVSILGGPPVALAEFPGGIAGASWGRDDQIIVGNNGGGLMRVPGGGGEPEVLTTLDVEKGESAHRWPSVISGRDAVVFTIATGIGRAGGAELAVLDLSSSEVRPLGIAGFSAQYVSTGHLVYAAEDNSIRAVPFDGASFEVIGNPVPLIEDVGVRPNGAANYHVSDNGRLVYASGRQGGGQVSSLVWVDRSGGEEPVPVEPSNYVWARVSPDGGSVTWQEDSDVWVSDLLRPGARIKVTVDPSQDGQPLWTLDGQHIVFQSARAGQPGLFRKAADGTGEAEQILTVDGTAYLFPYQFTPDGETLVVALRMPGTSDDFGMVSMGEDQNWQSVLHTEAREGNPAISPDGEWVAYRSHETGQPEVYVAAFPTMQQRQPVSIGGGWSPVWSPDGTELFYQNGRRMMRVPVTNEPSLTLGTPELLFEGPYASGVMRNYDVAPDGRFLMVRSGTPSGVEDSAPPQINVVLNWFEEIKQRVPVP